MSETPEDQDALEPAEPTPAPRHRSPLLDLDGAVEADPPEAGVAAHYGSIAHEQRALEAGTAFVDLSHRDVVTVTGPDRLTWLHSLTTQHLEHLAPHQPTEALLLTPQGRIEHAFAAIDDGETFWMHTEPGAGPALADWLDRMRFMMRVEVADVTDAWAVLGRPGLAWSIESRADVAGWPERHGTPAGIWAWEAQRIAAGHPRFGLDTDERTIPNEVGLLERAVHLDKGCYRGQETVARVHTLGKPPRRLVLLHLDGSDNHLPAHGAALELDGKTVGTLGSAARHHELGPIALGVVKRNVPTDATLVVDGVAAAQDLVVDPEVGLHVRPRLHG